MPRPKGSRNKVTEEGREFARKIVADPTYQASLMKRAREGRLGAVEATLWHYAWGKPKDTLEVRSAPIPLVIDLARTRGDLENAHDPDET